MDIWNALEQGVKTRKAINKISSFNSWSTIRHADVSAHCLTSYSKPSNHWSRIPIPRRVAGVRLTSRTTLVRRKLLPATRIPNRTMRIARAEFAIRRTTLGSTPSEQVLILHLAVKLLALEADRSSLNVALAAMRTRRDVNVKPTTRIVGELRGIRPEERRAVPTFVAVERVPALWQRVQVWGSGGDVGCAAGEHPDEVPVRGAFVCAVRPAVTFQSVVAVHESEV
jgi:hypothetical protein